MSELTKDLIQHAIDKDYNKANEIFGQIMTTSVQDVLDQEKIRLTNLVYNDNGQAEMDLKDADEQEAEDNEVETGEAQDVQSGEEDMDADTDSTEEPSDDVQEPVEDGEEESTDGERDENGS